MESAPDVAALDSAAQADGVIGYGDEPFPNRLFPSGGHKRLTQRSTLLGQDPALLL